MSVGPPSDRGVDVAALRLAYLGLLDVVDRAVEGGPGADPPVGEWDVGQLLAHLAAVDAGVLAAAATVAAGGRARFDNRSSLDAGTLALVEGRLGGPAGLRRRIAVQAEALSALAEQLAPDELDQPVATVLQSGDVVLLDGPLSLRDLVAGLADDHLPRHALQLLALLEPAAPSAVDEA